MNSSSYIILDKVYFIESLPDEDKSTAEDLRDSIEYERSKPDWFSLSFNFIETKQELFECFQKIKKEVQEFNVFPIIHLEFHGNKEQKGAVLKNGEYVSWKFIVKELQDINVLTRLNLIVFLGACFGFHSIEFIAPNNRAPFFLLVAPHEEVYPIQLSKIYKPFYQELFKSKKLDNALDAIRNISLQENFENISFITVAAYFKIFVQGYLKQSKATANRNKRIDKLSSELKEEPSGFLKNDEELLKIWITLNIDTAEEKMLKDLDRKFFMRDLYKENSKRFPNYA